MGQTIKFVANTGGGTVVLGMDIRLRNGENEWDAELAAKILTKDIVDQFEIKMPEAWSFTEFKRIKKALENKVVVLPPAEPGGEEIITDTYDLDIKRIRDDANGKILLSPAKFTKNTPEGAKKLLSECDDMDKLLSLSAKLVGYSGKIDYKKMVEDRIAELANKE